MHPPIAFIHRYDGSDVVHEHEWISTLSALMPEETIISIQAMDATTRASVELAIVANPDPADVASLPNLKWIHSVWAGVERLVAELGKNAPPIVRLIEPEMTRTMAESVLAWCYYLQRDMPLYARQQRKKIWQALLYRPPSSLTIGLIGLGVLAQAAAHKLQQAGFNVAGWSRSAKQLPSIETFTGENGLTTLLGKSDIVVLLLPLTKETHNLFNKTRFAALKKGAGLINFARGPIIDSQALTEALQQGIVSHAVLDVFVNEPISQDCPYWHHDQVTVLPHITAPTPLASASEIVAKNVREWRHNGKIPATIDPKCDSIESLICVSTVCFHRNSCPKTASHFSGIALNIVSARENPRV